MNYKKMLENSTLFGIAVGVGCGFCLAWLLKGKIRSTNPIVNKIEKGVAEVMGEGGEAKLVLVVRSDLKMGKGKIAAQCAHAAVMSYQKSERQDKDMLYKWRNSGQPKVVTKAENEQILFDLATHAQSLGLITSLVQDAGRTQIAPGSRTVLGVGPGPASVVDQVTGHLKLY